MQRNHRNLHLLNQVQFCNSTIGPNAGDAVLGCRVLTWLIYHNWTHINNKSTDQEVYITRWKWSHDTVCSLMGFRYNFRNSEISDDKSDTIVTPRSRQWVTVGSTLPLSMKSASTSHFNKLFSLWTWSALYLRYDTRCYIDVRSKANMSQLNLPHGADN